MVFEKIRYQIREKDELEKKKGSSTNKMSRHGSIEDSETNHEKRAKYEKGRNFREFEKGALKNDL